MTATCKPQDDHWRCGNCSGSAFRCEYDHVNALGELKEPTRSKLPGAKERHPRFLARYNGQGFSVPANMDPDLEDAIFAIVYAFETSGRVVEVLDQDGLTAALDDFTPATPGPTPYSAKFRAAHPLPSVDKKRKRPSSPDKPSGSKTVEVVDLDKPEVPTTEPERRPSKKPRTDVDQPVEPPEVDAAAPEAASPVDDMAGRVEFVAVSGIRTRFNELIGTLIATELQLLDLARREELLTGLSFGDYDGGYFGSVVAPLQVGQFAATWRVAAVSEEGRLRVPRVVAGRARRSSGATGTAAGGEGSAAGPSA